jgi:hypothetical protein
MSWSFAAPPVFIANASTDRVLKDGALEAIVLLSEA